MIVKDGDRHIVEEVRAIVNRQRDKEYPDSGRMRCSYDDERPDDEHLNRGRMYCGYDDEVLERRSVNRYRFSLNYVKEGDVCLDAASGSGYGSELISQKARKVIGLEISGHALQFAQEHYQNDKIEFRKADLTQPLDLPDDYFNVIVSVETLEHIANHDVMLSEFKRVLKPGGLLIITTVEHYIYTEKGGIKNKFHVGELTKKELINLLAKYFELEELYGHLRYVPLPRRKHFTKKLWVSFTEALGKLDIFGIRYWVIKRLRLNSAVKTVSQSLSTIFETDMEKSDFEDENEYYQLLVVARNS